MSEMNPTPESEMPARKRRSIGFHVARGTAWLIASVALLLVLLVAGVSWYTTTPDFQQRVGKEVVSVLEDATGGKVELAHVSFDLWHLAVEADGLVIHGLEGPGEAPYLSAQKILIRIKLLNLFARTAGIGPASKVSLDFLRVEHPQVHLIIDANGKTNQPVPKHPSTNNTPVQDTLLDLKARDIELADGIALLNDKAIPFDLAAQDLNAQVNYIAASGGDIKSDKYGIRVDLNDLRTRMQKQPEAQSKLHIEAELGRDAAELKKFTLDTGQRSELRASAAINHFNNPEWRAAVEGTLELKQISILSGVEGLAGGTLDLDVKGHNCYVAPVEAQKKPSFFRRLHPEQKTKPSVKDLPPDPECQKGYLLVGNVKTHDADYITDVVRVRDVNAGAQLKITPSELLFSALTGELKTGGSAEGDLRIENWLGEVPASAPAQSATAVGAVTTANKTAVAVGKTPTATTAPGPAVLPAHAYLNVVTKVIPLRTIMDIAAPKNAGDLGFDTAVSGPVTVEWGGSAAQINDTVEVEANLSLAPTGQRRRGALNDIPVSGVVKGHYTGKNQTVKIEQVAVRTPQSNLDASGILGVAAGDRFTALNVDLNVRDLNEYDQLLTTLGLTANGKKGRAAIPIDLHGQAQFHGTATGEIAKLDIKGHLQATNFEVKIPNAASPAPATLPNGQRATSTRQQVAVAQNLQQVTTAIATQNVVNSPPSPPPAETDVQIDSLVADAEYTPSGLAVGSSTIKRGSAVLNLAGTVKPRKVVSRRGVVTYEWDNGTAVDATVKLAEAQIVDVLQIAGQQQAIPVTGVINVNAHAAGLASNLSGNGHIGLTKGVAYGEPYDFVNVDLTVQGKDIEASNVALQLHGAKITGNGGYDLGTERLHAHLQGDNLVLSQFKTVQNANVNADGVLNLLVDANGTVTEPGLKANLRLTNFTVQKQPVGQLTAEIHSERSTAFYTLTSSLVGASVNAQGQTELTGNYETQAKLGIAGLDVAKPLALFQPAGLKASSNIGGTITVSGPLKTPQQLGGLAVIDNFGVQSQGIELKAAQPLRVSLKQGVATIEQLHIVGTDTDLNAGGTVVVFPPVDPKTGKPDPNGGALNIKATGSINPAIAHTLDPDIITSGKVGFQVAVGGGTAKPQLGGDVQFVHVNAAVDGVANGLTDMNGTLTFTEDRLQVTSLTATTGGGLLKLGGYLTYRAGMVYADMTATGDNVRVRLNGLSTTANANLRLQGGPQNVLLSGNVLITRFGVGADVDFAAFAGTGGVAPPPDPSDPSNKIRLDVHVTSSPQLDFQNSYAKLAGTVDLNIRGSVAEPTVLGRINITDGSATFSGTQYRLQRGDVYFSNPVRIDPVVDIDATARVEQYDVTVGVHGTATNLKPTYRSEPPLSEADIFSLLALGRTQEESQLYSEQQQAAGTDPATSSLLGGALNATVSNRVGKLFGGGSVKIDPSYVGTLGNSSARITVQQQLSKQLTLTYATNVNSSAQQLISIQYQFTPTQSVVATRDENDVFSIVYKIRKRYK